MYSGYNLNTNEEVAIKLEALATNVPMLRFEASIYLKLAGKVGIPNVHWIGVEGEFTVMIMDILGPSLRELFDFCDQKFQIDTVLKIGIDLITRMESLHEAGYLHRDIKPENFLVGTGKKANTVCMIDFGLSKRYKCPTTNNHIQECRKYGTVGTPRYLSLNAFIQREQSRRDDMEAIGNLLIMFANKGRLPWIDLEGKSMKKQMNFRLNLTMEELCQGLPDCFQKYMIYCQSILEFTAKPDYDVLRSWF